MAVAQSRPILLIGVSGQVGWELLRSLRSLGNVIGTVRKTASDSSPLRVLDVADLAAIDTLIRRVRPALIVNASAYTAVDKAESEPQLAHTINALAVQTMATAARDVGAAIVHYSTDYVFAGTGEQPWQETDPTAPLSVYGHTKREGELLLAASGVPHLILRTSWVYGVHGNNFVKTMLRLGASRPELRVVADQVGAPTSARVLADLTCQIVAQGRNDWSGWLAERGGIVHAACSGETNWHGFANSIFALARQAGYALQVERVLPIATAEYPTPAARPANSRLSLELLKTRFGLVPPDWQVALADSFDLLLLQHQRSTSAPGPSKT